MPHSKNPSPLKKQNPFPSKEDILSFLKTSQTPKISKREIARAFNIKGMRRVKLKTLLQKMTQEGLLTKDKGQALRPQGILPAFCTVDIVALTPEGFPIGRALQEEEVEVFSPVYFLNPMPKGDNLAIGDRILARLEKEEDSENYKGFLIRPIEHPKKEIIAIYRHSPKIGDYVVPTNLKFDESYPVDKKFTHSAKPGDLVRVLMHEDFKGKPHGKPRASKSPVRVLQVLGHESDPKLFSLIVIHALDIPIDFNDKTLKEAQKATVPDIGKRQDLRSYPLVTIDGEDARDFDDAIWAERDPDPKNPDGFHLIIAIADVAHYVRPGSSIEKDAYDRGNSVYFPDRVVPMLPEELSNNLCSLRPNEDRASLVCHLWITSTGDISAFHFARALIKSHARLTYTQVQAFLQGHTPTSTPLPERVQHLIPILYDAYKALSKNRASRGTLDLDLPERQVIFDDLGRIEKIIEKPLYESHKLIEEFMIAANVAAATFLSNTSLPCMYRVHDSPAFDKVETLRGVLKPLGLCLPPQGKIAPKDLNSLLHKTRNHPEERIVHQLVLRSQSQAIYSPRNVGHYGLGLQKYAHFTSPIRRYSDLLIHRALISALSLGNDGLSPETSFEEFEEIGLHISQTERRAMQAERETMSRYLISYMEEHIHTEFDACISGVTRSGLFIELLENGANGFIPCRLLPSDYYTFNEKTLSLKGTRGATFKLGDSIRAQLLEASSLTNNLIFRVIDPVKHKKKKQIQNIKRKKFTKN